jgi:hypothetical protein
MRWHEEQGHHVEMIFDRGTTNVGLVVKERNPQGKLCIITRLAPKHLSVAEHGQLALSWSSLYASIRRYTENEMLSGFDSALYVSPRRDQNLAVVEDASLRTAVNEVLEAGHGHMRHHRPTFARPGR